MPRILRIALIIAALLVAGVAAAATSTNTKFRIAGLPPIVLTASGANVAVTGIDGGASRTKKSYVQKWIVNGNEVDVLLRFEVSHGQLWIDMVNAASIGSLSAAATALDLSTPAPGHPSPAKDGIDTAAITAAGG